MKGMLLGRFLYNAAKKCSLYRRKDSQIYQHTGGEHLLWAQAPISPLAWKRVWLSLPDLGHVPTPEGQR